MDSVEQRMIAYPAPGVVHGKSVPRFNAEELLFFSFIQIGQYPCQRCGGVRTFATAAGGIVFSIEVPHGFPPVLKWLHSLHYAY